MTGVKITPSSGICLSLDATYIAVSGSVGLSRPVKTLNCIITN